MANFKGVVYLTNEQYITLQTNGTITVGDVTLTYDENTLYVTPDSEENAIIVINNLTSTSTTDALSAMQGKVLNDMMTTLAHEVVLVQNYVSGLDQNVSDNTEQIQFLQDDMRGKTNVAINNVHQDYVNFSSDPQTQLNNKANKDLSNVNFPIGYIYLSVNETSPASLFGGTWEQLKDRFLLGAGDTYTNGITGGQETVTLTIDQIPTHKHLEYWGANPIGDSNGNGESVKCNLPTYSQTTTSKSNYTSEVGGSQEHENMPPYLVVYMWKKVG